MGSDLQSSTPRNLKRSIAMSATDDDPIPTDWPPNLNPPPSFYFHRMTLSDAAKLLAQGLKRYHKDPAAWIAKVQEWQAANPEYVAAHRKWWWKANRNEERLKKMRIYTRQWRANKRALQPCVLVHRLSAFTKRYTAVPTPQQRAMTTIRTAKDRLTW